MYATKWRRGERGQQFLDRLKAINARLIPLKKEKTEDFFIKRVLKSLPRHLEILKMIYVDQADEKWYTLEELMELIRRKEDGEIIDFIECIALWMQWVPSMDGLDTGSPINQFESE